MVLKLENYVMKRYVKLINESLDCMEILETRNVN